ncbi:MAG: hypothetical protein ACREYA_38545 [Cupriavidus necator]
MSDIDNTPPRKSFASYLWGALAVVTCPCHLPLLAIVLPGAAAGSFIGDHWGLAAAVHAFNGRS